MASFSTVLSACMAVEPSALRTVIFRLSKETLSFCACREM